MPVRMVAWRAEEVRLLLCSHCSPKSKPLPPTGPSSKPLPPTRRFWIQPEFWFAREYFFCDARSKYLLNLNFPTFTGQRVYLLTKSERAWTAAKMCPTGELRIVYINPTKTIGKALSTSEPCRAAHFAMLGTRDCFAIKCVVVYTYYVFEP